MALLEARGLSLRFGGIAALEGVSFDLAPGETLGLIGPNGSGKTSLLNLLTGHLAPSAGSLRMGGAPLGGLPPHRIARLGVRRTFQTPRLMARATVLENVRAALHAAAPPWETLWQTRAARRAERARLLHALSQVGLAERTDAVPAALTLSQMRGLEIARALAPDPRLLLLDEPAAGMTAPEAARLADLLARVLLGRAAILVEHRTALVSALCPRTLALARGAVVAEGPTGAVLAAPALRARYFGGAA